MQVAVAEKFFEVKGQGRHNGGGNGIYLNGMALSLSYFKMCLRLSVAESLVISTSVTDCLQGLVSEITCYVPC